MTSHTITMTRGAVTAGRQALADAFRALPDGDYTVTIAPVGDPAAAISDIVGWYGQLGEAELNDPNLGNVLTEKARLLDYHCTNFSRQVSAAKREATTAKNRAKAKRVLEVERIINDASQAGVKLTDTAIKRAADAALLEADEYASVCHSVATTLAAELEMASNTLGLIKYTHIPMLRKGHGG